MPGRNGAVLFSELSSAEKITMGGGGVFGQGNFVKAQPRLTSTQGCGQRKTGRIFFLLSAFIEYL